MFRLTAKLRRLRSRLQVDKPIVLNLTALEVIEFAKPEGPTTELLPRALSAKERAIAEWLLTHSAAPASTYLAQLDHLRAVSRCLCGCPTVELAAEEGAPRGEPCGTPMADALGQVGGKQVGVMLLAEEGLIVLLEIYDWDEIERPYGLPELSTLEPARWALFNG